MNTVTIYVLSDELGNRYIRITSDMQRRLQEHKSGRARSTKHFRKAYVVYSEEADSYSEARQREKYLKSATGRRFLKGHDSIQRPAFFDDVEKFG